MAEQLGYEGVLLHAAAATTFPVVTGTADQTCTSLRSVTPDNSRGEADMTKRANQGQVVTRPGRRTISMELEFVYNAADALQALLETMYYADTDEVIALAFHDSDTSPSGFSGQFGVYSHSVSQPSGDEPQILTVTVKPRDALVPV